MKKQTNYLLLLAILCMPLLTWSQVVPSSIASWRNNAKGCYNIIHDDFGDYAVLGIQNYADTMNSNRGLKFTFGAITKSCEQNPNMYSRANEMIQQHNHEIINHSHSHTCAIKNSWCVTGLWAEAATRNFETELDYSTESIEKNTGMRPRYFIFPYDQFNEDANDHLKGLNYIGSRTGKYENFDSEGFAPDNDGFFRSAVIVDAETQGGVTKAINLNYWADYAATNGVWVNRELHNVGNNGWGYVTVDEYRNHLNHVKAKVDANQLWVGTISEILTYQIQKVNYTPTAQYNSGMQQVIVSWSQPNFNVASYLAPLQIKSPITLNVDISKISDHSNLIVTQNGNTITDVTINGNMLVTNLYPHEGDVMISSQGCPNICLTKHPSNQTAKLNQNATFSVDVQSNQTVSYQWYFDSKAISGATNSSYTISQVQLENLGKYYVIASNSLGTATSIEVELKLSELIPYTGTPTIINSNNTKIEFEDYDHGGQFLSYYDTKGGNQGSVYRTDNVDIYNGMSKYYVDQIKDEWTVYSVEISEEGIYSIEFNGDVIEDSTRLVLEYNGQKLMDTITVEKATTDNIITPSIALKASNGTFKITITRGNIKVDNFTFKYEGSSTKADFTVSKQESEINTSILFTDASLGDNITSYEWNFGKNAVPQTATSKGPHTVTYTTSGEKTVSLIINGKYSTIKKDFITVSTNNNNKQNCSFETDFNSNSDLKFTDIEINDNPFFHQMTSETWKITTNNTGIWSNFTYHFNDGLNNKPADFSNPSHNPIVTIRAKASSQVELRVDMVDKEGDYTDKVSNGKNLITLTTQYKTFTIDYSNEFYNYYGCTNGCGVMDSTNIRGLAFFLNAGFGGFNGTVDIDFIQVGDGDCNLVADFTSSSTGVCKNGNITFEDASLGTANSYEWNFGTDAFPQTKTGKGPHSVSYSSTGIKTVTLTLNGAKSISKTIIVTNELSLSIGDDKKVCKDINEISFVAETNGNVNWNSTGTGSFIGQGKTVTYLPSEDDKIEKKINITASATANGCSTNQSKEISVQFEVCTNINNETGRQQIKLYPNPAEEQINIEMDSELSAQITIFDVLGNVVYDNPDAFGTLSVDIETLVSGIYTVKIISNHQLYTLRFIKK